MVILFAENVSPGLRGEISRWMIEPKAGVFVGRISAEVRERIYHRACKSSKGGSVTLIYSSNTEQGYDIKTFGDRTRKIANVEGLWLVKEVTNSSS